MNKFIVRALSGIVYAGLMIGGLLVEPIYYLILLFFLVFVGSKELFDLSKKIFPNEGFPYFHFLIAVHAIVCLILFVMLNDSLFLLPIIAMTVIMLTTIVITKHRIAASVGTILFCVLYIGIPMMAMAHLKFLNYIIPLSVLCMVWINDTMAYITGSIIGKTPLSPISPKKTIEGTLGGIVFTILFAGIFGYYYTHEFPIWVWMSLAAIVGVFGNVGDLFESYLKRQAGVKDSGNIMPGHGGVLDRIDSLLFVFPIVYVFLISLKLL